MQAKLSELLNKITGLTGKSSFPNISSLEYDLLMQHLRDLYEEINRLKAAGQDVSEQEEIIVTVPQPKAEPQIQKVVSPVQKEIPVMKEELPVKAIAKVSINETAQTSESLNSKLKVTAKEIHQKLSSKPMKELIDFNKRFAVVSELFKGDADACVKAIHQIDIADSYAAAEEYIHSTLFPTFHWKESSETVKLFQSLVKQRFGVE